MKFLQLKKHLTEGASIMYVLTGSDSLLKKMSENLFIEKFKSNGSDINVSIFDKIAADNIDNVFSLANTMAFFNSKRLIVIRGYETKIKEQLIKKLKKYNQEKNDCTIVLHDSDEKLIKSIKKEVVEIDCSHLDSASLLKYISNKVTKANRIITKSAAIKLIDYTTSNLSDIDNELQKIIYYVDPKDRITEDIIEKFVSKTIDYKIYELTNFMGKKDNENVIKVLNQLFNDKVSEMAMLTLVYNHFSRLFHIAINMSMPNKEIAKYLNIKEYAVLKLKPQVAKFKKSELMRIMNEVMMAEFNIKSGKVSAKNAIYSLVIAQ